jgi:hypothetical protein
MRSDMAKVIVERPRHRGSAWKKPKGYQRRLRRYGEDGPPAREGIKARWENGGKYLNEHLGPLRRYLDKQVGRPWDKVFSEICAHINRSSAVQDHVRDHVEGYVATHVLLIDGVPCSGEGGIGYGKPLRTYRHRTWYVCPKTGLLRRVPSTKRKGRSRLVSDHRPTFIPLGKSLQCRLMDDAWHLVTLAPLPDPYYHWGQLRAIDVLLRRPVTAITVEEARRHYGAAVYAVAKRRIPRRELRQYPIPERWWR